MLFLYCTHGLISFYFHFIAFSQFRQFDCKECHLRSKRIQTSPSFLKLSKEKASLPSWEPPNSNGPSKTSRRLCTSAKQSNHQASKSTPPIRRISSQVDRIILKWRFWATSRIRSYPSFWSTKRLEKSWRRSLLKVFLPRSRVKKKGLALTCGWQTTPFSRRLRSTAGNTPWPSLWPSLCPIARLTLRRKPTYQMKWSSS